MQCAEYTEPELLQAVADGHETAFGELFNRYHHLLGHHIYRITESRELTEEIVQDVFLKIWMTRESLSEVKNFRTWVYVLSRNYTLNAMRKIIRERTQQKEWVKDSSNSTDPAPNNEAHFTLVDEAIAALSPQQKTVYQLGREQGLTYAEIATQMGISKETVKYYMKLALASITQFVQDRIELILFIALLGQ
jgi:RNA polymerase sigma-70 factor (ECF subfamily)